MLQTQPLRGLSQAGHVKAAGGRGRHSLPTQASTSPRQQASPLTVQRREALLSAAALVLGTSLALPAVAEECELVTAPNGLQYCDLTVGTGDSPVAGSMIRAHYDGRLASNGAKFDSSYDRGRPFQFKVGARQVIQGWDLGILGTEGIPPMKAGGKRRLIIPPELGYGDRGAGGVIPPGATLLFDVELLGKR